MSATITISTKEIKQIFQQRTSDPSELWKLAEKGNILAVTVENSWDKLPVKKQELLRYFAYMTLEDSEDFKSVFIKQISRLFSALILVRIVLKGELNAFLACANAFQRLVNAILSAIERENLAYEKALSEAIENAIIDAENDKAMTAGEACERIREISNKALEEF